MFSFTLLFVFGDFSFCFTFSKILFLWREWKIWLKGSLLIILCEKLENSDFLMSENSMSEGSMNSGRMSTPECYQTHQEKAIFGVASAERFFEVRRKLRSCGNTLDKYSKCETEAFESISTRAWQDFPQSTHRRTTLIKKSDHPNLRNSRPFPYDKNVQN